MTFKFSLNKLLSLKLQQEKQELIVLAQWRRKLGMEINKLAQLEHTYAEHAERIDNKARFTMDELIVYHSYFPLLQEKIKSRLQTCKKMESETEAVLQRLTTIIRERKTLEKLKEKKYRQFLVEINQSEQKHLDEIALSRRYLSRCNRPLSPTSTT